VGIAFDVSNSYSCELGSEICGLEKYLFPGPAFVDRLKSCVSLSYKKSYYKVTPPTKNHKQAWCGNYATAHRTDWL